MRIAYPEPVPVTLVYDDTFRVHCYESGSLLSWGELLMTIKEDIDQYGFEKCRVINSETGKILMVVVND